MNRLYLYVIGGAAAVGVAIGGFFVWRNRVVVGDVVSNSTARVRGTARSVWGRIETAADKLMHTERDPQAES